jgi:hypothetical protein
LIIQKGSLSARDEGKPCSEHGNYTRTGGKKNNYKRVGYPEKGNYEKVL